MKLNAHQQCVPRANRTRLQILLVGAYFMLCISASGVSADQEFSAEQISAIKSHGPWPQAMPADPGNQLSGLAWAETLGETLFFDKSLSVDKTLSCASCHNPKLAFSDGLPVGIGVQVGVRNTQGLLDIGLQRWFGWDGGADSLWSASIRPMLARHEMATTITQVSKSLRQNAAFTLLVEQYFRANEAMTKSESMAASKARSVHDLSDDQIVVFAAKSIAAYMRTLTSEQTAFDRFRQALINGDLARQQAYTAAAKRGLKLFLGEANCHVCHFGPNFSNGEFHDTGRPFFTAVGEVDPGRYKGIQRVVNDPFNLAGNFGVSVSDRQRRKTTSVKLGQVNWGQWRTPSLRHLRHTGPYTHDGSLDTLRDVVDAYADIDPERLHASGESILKPLNMNDQQRNDLVEFLLTLSQPD